MSRLSSRTLRWLLENNVLSGDCVAPILLASFFRWYSLKNGDSSRFLKINQPSNELKSPEKNMQRQPHTANASPGKIDDVTRKTNDASNAPMPAPPPPISPDIAPR